MTDDPPGQPMTVREADLKQTDAGLVPQGEGWFVLNARDASWIRSEERGQDTDFEGGQEWAQLGFRIQVVAPGQRGVYHAERGQEDFLVVSGECVLVIEGQERRLKAWDFVHCPPWTRHVFVGAGDAPCVIVMVGSRVGGFEVLYPVNEVAAKHDASVLEETSSPDEAHARWGPEERSGYDEGVAAVLNDPDDPTNGGPHGRGR
jgi:quercetin dioxygenase-like cupin family protein